MFKRPQFSLKALFVIIMVLAVPLGMLVSGDDVLAPIGELLASPVVCGCIGYLLGGWKRGWVGAFIGLIAYCVIPACTSILF